MALQALVLQGQLPAELQWAASLQQVLLEVLRELAALQPSALRGELLLAAQQEPAPPPSLQPSLQLVQLPQVSAEEPVLLGGSAQQQVLQDSHQLSEWGRSLLVEALVLPGLQKQPSLPLAVTAPLVEELPGI